MSNNPTWLKWYLENKDGRFDWLDDFRKFLVQGLGKIEASPKNKTNVYNTLLRNGFDSLEKFKNAESDDFFKCRGIGEKCYEVIRQLKDMVDEWEEEYLIDWNDKGPGVYMSNGLTRSGDAEVAVSYFTGSTIGDLKNWLDTLPSDYEVELDGFSCESVSAAVDDCVGVVLISSKNWIEEHLY